MANNKSKIQRNVGKVEFIANLSTVNAMLYEGNNLKNVYDMMIEDGKFTMSYGTFCYHYRLKTKSDEHKKQESKPVLPALTTPPTIPIATKSKSGFVRPQDIDVNTLF